MEVENSCEPKKFYINIFFTGTQASSSGMIMHTYMLYLVWTGHFLLSDGSWPISFQSTAIFVLFLFKIIYKIILF